MRKITILFVSLFFISACITRKNIDSIIVMNKNIDIQGHRGCRGLYPENTIPGMIHALDLGVHTLEMDVVVSSDYQVIVSHDPFLSHHFCSDLKGERIDEKVEKNYNIFRLTAKELASYDTGLLFHEKYPAQKKMATHKPTLKNLVTVVEAYVADNNLLKPNYNIEIKRVKENDNIFHPEYKKFTDLTLKTIASLGIKDRTTVQCFDIEVLQYMEEKYSDWSQVYLIENLKSIEKNLERLGHIPEIYSPYYKLVNAKMVAYCRSNNMKLIPWTVNEKKDMIKMMELDVDGIITDYPNILIELVNDLK